MFASTRSCHFCGQLNESGYAFCKKCGRQLPLSSPVPSSPAAGFPAPPPPPVMQQPDEFDTTYDRSLTQDEVNGLKMVQKSSGVGGARVLATLFGIAPLLLIFLAIMGTPFDPVAFPAVMMGSGFIALITGAIAMQRRYPAAYAIARGNVREVRGVPRKRSGGTGMVTVSIGGIDFTSKDSIAERLQEGRMNVLVYLPPDPSLQGMTSQRAWIVSINGAVLKHPTPCTEAPAADFQNLPPPPPPQFLGYGGK